MKELDRKTRKMLTLHYIFAKKGDVDRLYMSRKEGRQDLISVEDCILMESNNLFVYTSNSTEPFLQEVAKEGTIKDGSHKNEVKRSRKESLMEKSMHSVFFNKTDFRDTRSWEWSRTGDLKKTTEDTIMAAQEQAIRTRMIRHTIGKENISPLCRMCGERNETVAHLVSECTKLAQKQDEEWRHDAICRVIHWRMCIDYGLDHADKWYDHRPEAVVENEEIKSLWDMRIQTDKTLKHNKQDILLMDKIKKKFQIRVIAAVCEQYYSTGNHHHLEIAYKPLNRNKSSLKYVLSQYLNYISLMSQKRISWLLFVLLSLSSVRTWSPVCGRVMNSPQIYLEVHYFRMFPTI